MPIDIETLNGPQREAVVTIDGPLLVLDVYKRQVPPSVTAMICCP